MNEVIDQVNAEYPPARWPAPGNRRADNPDGSRCWWERLPPRTMRPGPHMKPPGRGNYPPPARLGFSICSCRLSHGYFRNRVIQRPSRSCARARCVSITSTWHPDAGENLARARPCPGPQNKTTERSQPGGLCQAALPRNINRAAGAYRPASTIAPPGKNRHQTFVFRAKAVLHEWRIERGALSAEMMAISSWPCNPATHPGLRWTRTGKPPCSRDV